MSTRTNVVLKSTKGHEINLYRHYDGYPAVTGEDIYVAANWLNENRKSPIGKRLEMAADILLSQRYEQASYETEPRAIYTTTDGIHGDIEHLYFVAVDAETGEATIHYSSRPADWADRSDDHSFMDVAEWANGETYTPVEFVEVVNRDRREMKIEEMLEIIEPQAANEADDDREPATAGSYAANYDSIKWN